MLIDMARGYLDPTSLFQVEVSLFCKDGNGAMAAIAKSFSIIDASQVDSNGSVT